MVALEIAKDGNGDIGRANGTNMIQTNNISGAAVATTIPPRVANPNSTPSSPYTIQQQIPAQPQPPFRLAPSVYDPSWANEPRYSTTDSLNGISPTGTPAYSPHDSLRSWNAPPVYSTSDSQMPTPGNVIPATETPAYSPHDSLRSWNGTPSYSTSDSQMPIHGMPVYTPSGSSTMHGMPVSEYRQQ